MKFLGVEASGQFIDINAVFFAYECTKQEK